MAENEPKQNTENEESRLSGGTYEIIRNRLNSHAKILNERLNALNDARKTVFGAIEARLITQERVTTDHNCIPKDMICLGDQLLFGYNVHLGLRSEFKISDVFAVYNYEDHSFQKAEIAPLKNDQFEEDFHNLYRYYKDTAFAQFARIGTYLFMVFRVGKDVDAIKTFKWLVNDDHTLTYVDNRSDHEYKFPPQHEFEWIRATRDQQRGGAFPHVSIEDRIFVETTGGDLTIKVEDNTDTGSGIYAELVDDPDQTLDDAEFHYAIVGNLILLKIKPYRENDYRYIVFNEKVQEAKRIDTIEDACVLLPEDHGIIFANGYYLQNGEFKIFDSELDDMHFRKRVISPNGEDTLFVFYNKLSGTYMLLSYNMIEQTVATPTICNGFSTFDNGEMIFFRSDAEPKKHHPIQVWQTPYIAADYETPTESDSYLYKLGNKDVVRAMAACRAVLNLVGKEESYANVYVDIVREATDILDAYFWLEHEDAQNIKEPLTGIRSAAEGAIDEFEKVVRLRKNTKKQVAETTEGVHKILSSISTRRFDVIGDFVELLGELRTARGRVIGLKDLHYVNLDEVAKLEGDIETNTDSLANRCVTFLLSETALDPYLQRVEKIKAAIEPVSTVKDAKEIETEISDSGKELEMLIEIVSNLKIEDATERTKIIDSISDIYATLNQTRSVLSGRIKSLASTEGKAEFGSQIKLLDQAVLNYLDVCDTPEKCEEYLTKVTVQISELEGKFADFDEFIIELTDKRDEIYNTFESRKVSLVEARNKKTDAYLRSAERILNGISTRVAQLETSEEINGYFASDLMVDKVRDIIDKLRGLDDNVKADDIQSRLKTLSQDTLRQLRDRNELFVGGKDVLKFGEHHFSVNTQELALTIVDRDDGLYLHLTGTNFFEKIKDPRIVETQTVWNQSLVSENKSVYRGEYLAYRMLCDLRKNPEKLDKALEAKGKLGEMIKAYMAPRYAEGYIKGVHDVDAAVLLQTLLEMETTIGLLRYPTQARALAMLFWHQLGNQNSSRKATLTSKLKGVGELAAIFSASTQKAQYVEELTRDIAQFNTDIPLFDPILHAPAAEYLYEVLTSNEKWGISPEAAEIIEGLKEHLKRRGAEAALQAPLSALSHNMQDAFVLLMDWVLAYLSDRKQTEKATYKEEVAVLLLSNMFDRKFIVTAKVEADLKGLVGDHSVIQDGTMTLNYNDFSMKMARFDQETVPLFEHHQALKKHIVEAATEELRLKEFEPRILSSFVRNRLIDTVYLPLVGDNLAKQIGVVGANTRTDRMGLLLLISPPGYGKTTLMEYIANRLGLIFMKINGPAIGHKVTSLDPSEAPNAAAKEEMKKLNLSLEMGDNVMIYLDDIQHCNPEFLQKFISLCDAQRKIEGVYKGKTQTYDLRGRRVCVVMAGNPYSESGEAFKIPDMLANRADTYNLGEIIGGSSDAFDLSYIENALTSSPSLSKMATKYFKDVYGIVKAATSGSREGIEFEGKYDGAEIEEYISVMKKLLYIRDVILKVNKEYIYSAAQSDQYRTEPAFKLQGSYRNMNRITEKVLPIMNDEELRNLVNDHYQSESQTLTTASEANLLKYKELTNQLSQDDQERWDSIKSTFGRNQLLGEEDDPMKQVIIVLSTFKEGLDKIQGTLGKGVERMSSSTLQQGLDRISGTLEQGVERMSSSTLQQGLDRISGTLELGVKQMSANPLKGGLDKISSTLEQGVERMLPNDLKEGLDKIHSTLSDGIYYMSTNREGLDNIQGTLKEGIEQMASSTPIVIAEPAVAVSPSTVQATGQPRYVQAASPRTATHVRKERKSEPPPPPSSRHNEQSSQAHKPSSPAPAYKQSQAQKPSSPAPAYKQSSQAQKPSSPAPAYKQSSRAQKPSSPAPAPQTPSSPAPATKPKVASQPLRQPVRPRANALHSTPPKAASSEPRRDTVPRSVKPESPSTGAVKHRIVKLHDDEK